MNMGRAAVLLAQMDAGSKAVKEIHEASFGEVPGATDRELEIAWHLASTIESLEIRYREQEERRRLASLHYAEYIETPYFKDLAKKAIRNVSGHCRLCNSEHSICIHHRSRHQYHLRGDAKREIDALIVLCDDCFAKLHYPKSS